MPINQLSLFWYDANDWFRVKVAGEVNANNSSVSCGGRNQSAFFLFLPSRGENVFQLLDCTLAADAFKIYVKLGIRVD